MRSITATKHHPLSPKLRVSIHKNGELIGGDVVDPLKTSEIRRKICTPFSLLEADVLRALATPDVAVILPDETDNPVSPIAFTIRNKKSNESIESTLPLAELLSEKRGHDTLLIWNDTRLCCLDIDVDAPMTEPERVASLIRPRPALWHPSKNGGLHLYYETSLGFVAADLAACAAVWLRQYNSAWRCELKSVTHWPDAVHTQAATADVNHLLEWVRIESDSADIEALLEERGWSIGMRLPHTECLIEPKATSRGDAAIQIGDKGIYCYRCAGLGLTLGSRRPGFTPWSYFVNSGLCTAIRHCVANFTHWTQAGIVIEQELGFTGEIAQRAYRTLLRIWHGDDIRIERVFTAGKDLIRRRGQWMYLDGTPLKITNGKRELAALPALQTAQGVPIGPLLDRFCQGTDLTENGYAAVDVIHGAFIWGHYLPYADNRVATVKYGGRADTKPRYLACKDRMSLDNARNAYSERFPELPWEYLQLLICARGASEGAEGMPPLIYVWGASGAGKTQTVHLAASTIGDYNSEVNWVSDNQRFRQGILEGVQRGSFCTVNEIKKGAQRVRMPIDLALEPILTLTENSTSHQLYTGPVALGRLPVVVMTETSLPRDLLKCIQLTRRLISVQLHYRLAWDAGIGSRVQGLRSSGAEACKAADSLLSWMIDQYFREPLTLMEIAERLGFKRMESVAEDTLQTRATLLAFYRAVISAPDAASHHQRRWGGGGWKVVDQAKGGEESNTIDFLYFTLSDSHDFTQSVTIQEHDWTSLLGLSGHPPVECQLRTISPQHKSTVGIRFKRGTLTNAEICVR